MILWLLIMKVRANNRIRASSATREKSFDDFVPNWRIDVRTIKNEVGRVASEMRDFLMCALVWNPLKVLWVLFWTGVIWSALLFIFLEEVIYNSRHLIPWWSDEKVASIINDMKNFGDRIETTVEIFDKHWRIWTLSKKYVVKATDWGEDKQIEMKRLYLRLKELSPEVRQRIIDWIIFVEHKSFFDNTIDKVWLISAVFNRFLGWQRGWSTIPVQLAKQLSKADLRKIFMKDYNPFETRDVEYPRVDVFYKDWVRIEKANKAYSRLKDVGFVDRMWYKAVNAWADWYNNKRFSRAWWRSDYFHKHIQMAFALSMTKWLGKYTDGIDKLSMLEMYLNATDLKARDYGFRSAALAYFWEDDVSKLDWPQIAFLAWLFKDPNLDHESRIDRRDTVLEIYCNNWVIDCELKPYSEAFKNINFPSLTWFKKFFQVQFVFRDKGSDTSFMNVVERILKWNFMAWGSVPQYMLDREMWYKDIVPDLPENTDLIRLAETEYERIFPWKKMVDCWCRVYLPTDARLQANAKRALDRWSIAFHKKAYEKAELDKNSNAETNAIKGRDAIDDANGVIIVTRASTWEILAAVWWGAYDRVSDVLPVWSTIKPFIFAWAVEAGVDMSSAMLNGDNKAVCAHDSLHRPWCPKNYKEKSLWSIDATTALMKSVNSATLDLAKRAWMDNIYNSLERLWIKLAWKEPSVVLWVSEMSLPDLAGSYSIIVNRWIRRGPYVISHIQDNKWNIIYKARQTWPWNPDSIAKTLPAVSKYSDEDCSTWSWNKEKDLACNLKAKPQDTDVVSTMLWHVVNGRQEMDPDNFEAIWNMETWTWMAARVDWLECMWKTWTLPDNIGALFMWSCRIKWENIIAIVSFSKPDRKPMYKDVTWWAVCSRVFSDFMSSLYNPTDQLFSSEEWTWWITLDPLVLNLMEHVKQLK